MFPVAEIKKQPEDFIVEEITPDGKVLELDTPFSIPDEEGKFLHFAMQKKDWDTNSAIRRISRALRTSHKRFNTAGTKDKFAVTTQRVSFFAGNKEKVLNLKLQDIKILGAWIAKDKLKLGELGGNRFRIKIYGDEKPDLLPYFFNFFGPQRFGATRANTHLIGKYMIMKEYETAVKEYLLNYEGERSEISVSARKKLAEDLDYKKAFEYFPKHLKFERILLSHLATHSNDYIGALRKLPRTTVLMFIHAYQSYLFNIELSERISKKIFDKMENEYFCGADELGFPDICLKQDKGYLALNIIGYETTINELEKEILEREGIDSSMFKLHSMPELSSKGSFRTFFNFAKYPKWDGEYTVFSLSSGAYASTYLLHHFNLIQQDLPGFLPQHVHKNKELLVSLFD